MLLTPLQLVLVLQYLTNPSFMDADRISSYHKQCYQQYTHKNHLEHLIRKRLQDEHPEPDGSISGIAKVGGKVRRVSRLSASPVLLRLCIICNNQNKTDKNQLLGMKVCHSVKLLKQAISYLKLPESVRMKELLEVYRIKIAFPSSYVITNYAIIIIPTENPCKFYKENLLKIRIIPLPMILLLNRLLTMHKRW